MEQEPSIVLYYVVLCMIVMIFASLIVYCVNYNRLNEVTVGESAASQSIASNNKDEDNSAFSDVFYSDSESDANNVEPAFSSQKHSSKNQQGLFYNPKTLMATITTQVNQPQPYKKPVNITSIQNVKAISKQLLATNGTNPVKMIEILNSIDTSKLSSVDAKELLKVVNYINNVKNLQPNSIDKPSIITINYPDPTMLEKQPVAYVLGHIGQTTTMYQGIINNLAYVNSQMISSQR